MPELDVLEINIDEIIKEVFDNDTYKKDLEMNSKKLLICSYNTYF